MINENSNSIGEIMEPNPIGFSFDAPGWIMLIGLLLLSLLFFGLWKLYQYKKNKYRRVALKEMKSIMLGNQDSYFIVFSIISLLKRVAIKAYGREESASKFGIQFVNFLQEKTNDKIFSENSVSIFKLDLYQGKNTNTSIVQLEQLQNESINWINKHRV